MIKNTLFFIVLIFISLANLIAQQKNKCSSVKIREQRIMDDTSLLLQIQNSEILTQKWILDNSKKSKSNQVITIPVVVHIVYNKIVENISDAQIFSQIEILNQDFRLKNSNALPINHPYYQYTADTKIEFCLAIKDPYGNPTSGITRTKTKEDSFSDADDKVKYGLNGGKDNWDPTKYLNLWVCNLTGDLLGYATFPSDLTNYKSSDGVVIRHQAFGNIGTAGSEGFTANSIGRTATHEIGHWLNLNHIWGDTICGNDFVDDTKPSKNENYYCPTFPHNANSCSGTGPNGEMYMNYMDYANDDCMSMFTAGQGLRMHSALNGDRKSLLTSNGCGKASLNEVLVANSFTIYPNPSEGSFEINSQLKNLERLNIEIVNLLGEQLVQFSTIQSFPYQVNLNYLSNGGYFVKINDGTSIITQKIFISK
jgi:hypothetical protein